MKNQKFGGRILRGISLGLILALFGSAFFMPNTSLAELALPTTNCDSMQEAMPHLLSNMPQEDGTKAFAYGSDNNSFVSASEDKILFDVRILFSADSPGATIKLLALDSSCNLVFGFGPAFHNLNSNASNIVSYDRNTHMAELNGETRTSFPSGTIKYIWVEVVEDYPNISLASYSYLVDTDNLQNPTGTQEIPETTGIQRPAIIIPGIMGSAQKNGEWVMDPILHTYDDLVNSLIDNGYVEGETIFTFPYDWSRSNIDTAVDLKNKINAVKNICACDKVDIVAHSMGGLVARQYVQSDAFEDDVDNLIFLGTPHLGSPAAYLAWEGGQFGSSLRDQLLEAYITFQARKEKYANIYYYIRNKPIISIEELLPIYDYLKDYDTNFAKEYPNEYPTNLFLENLSDNYIKLLNSGTNIINIIGVLQQQNTIGSYRVKSAESGDMWDDGYPYDYNNPFTSDKGIDYVGGDRTVPQQSSALIVDQSIIIDSEHGSLPTNAKSIIYNKLTGLTLDLSPSQPEDKKILFIKLFSPVDMQIIAPDGQRIGKDFETDEEINEIEGAFYSGFETDNEFITILNPLDGEYKLITQGTDDGGEYTVASALISDEKTVEHDFQAQTFPGLIEEVKINVSSDEITSTPEDNTGPEIVINSPEHKDYFRTDPLNIDADISDSESSVFSSEIKLDNINVSNGDSVDLFFESLGEHSIYVSAEDLLGNPTNATQIFRLVATKESTVLDIQKLYELGLINSQSVAESLIAKLESNGKDKYKDFIKLLDSQRNKNVNEQAYQLLKENINWLINN